MKITEKQLKDLGACKEGLAWFMEQKDHELTSLVKSAIDKPEYINKGEKFNTLSFSNWGIVRLLDKPRQVQYAIYAAKQVLKIFEDRYPEDKRPRLAIEAAEKYLQEPSIKNKDAAYAAANAAYAAANSAANAAANAAYAAYAAADEVYSAADAAENAAYAAAYAANAKLKLKSKILRYGVKLAYEMEKGIK